MASIKLLKLIAPPNTIPRENFLSPKKKLMKMFNQFSLIFGAHYKFETS